MSFVEYLFSTTTSSPMVNSANISSRSESTESPMDDNLKPLDLSHGQCTWCGKYGHNRGRCPLLK